MDKFDLSSIERLKCLYFDYFLWFLYHLKIKSAVWLIFFKFKNDSQSKIRYQ